MVANLFFDDAINENDLIWGEIECGAGETYILVFQSKQAYLAFDEIERWVANPAVSMDRETADELRKYLFEVLAEGWNNAG